MYSPGKSSTRRVEIRTLDSACNPYLAFAVILGEHVFDFFLRNKRAEWDGYRRQVTPYELATYLPVL
jgi:glutamine synthetase